jgi:type VI protein secretion system component VasK
VTEQMQERFDTLTLALQIIRENGLIVLALFALMWQVWMTNTTAQAEAARWRDVIDAFRAAEVARDKEYQERSTKWLETLVSMREAISSDAATTREMVAKMTCLEGEK